MVSHLEFLPPYKPFTPNNIGEYIKIPHRQFWKEALFLQYNKNKNVRTIFAPVLIKSLPDRTKVLRSLILPQILNKADALIHVNLFHATVQMGVLTFKALILISPTVQWHILTPSEPTFL